MIVVYGPATATTGPDFNADRCILVTATASGSIGVYWTPVSWTPTAPPTAPVEADRPGDGLKRLRRALRLVHTDHPERRLEPRRASVDQRRKGRSRRGRVPSRSGRR